MYPCIKLPNTIFEWFLKTHESLHRQITVSGDPSYHYTKGIHRLYMIFPNVKTFKDVKTIFGLSGFEWFFSTSFQKVNSAIKAGPIEKQKLFSM